MNTLETEKVLKAFADKVVNRAINNLAKQDHIASGNLAENLDYNLEVYPSGALELEFTAPDYWKFQDKGVKGSKSGRKAYNSPFKFKKKNIKKGVVEAWVKRKGIQGRDRGYTKADGTKVKGTGRFIKHKTLSYLIGSKYCIIWNTCN